MLDKVAETIRRFGMLPQGGAVAVGLSGGADSVALTYSLTKLGFNVRAVHVNHMIRGDEARRDAEFVSTLCCRLGIPLDAFEIDVPGRAAEMGIGLEQCGRICRYECFDTIASQYNCMIATAHTLSDSVETVLFNITRGCAAAGLRGIPPVRGNIIRPLIEVTREEVEKYCADNGLCFVTDSTNSDTSYTRNRIRRNVVPELMKINPSLHSAVVRLSAMCREDDEFISGIAEQRLGESRIPGGFAVQPLIGLPAPVMRRTAVEMIKEKTGKIPEYRHVEKLCECITGGLGAVQLCGDYEARISQNTILIEKKHIITQAQAADEYWEKQLQFPESVLPDGRILKLEVLSADKYRDLLKINNLLIKQVLDYDIISSNIFEQDELKARTRREGDRFSQANRGVCKRVKKLFSESGIPTEKRGSILMLELCGDIIWIEGFGAAQGYNVTPDTDRVLVLQLEENYAQG